VVLVLSNDFEWLNSPLYHDKAMSYVCDRNPFPRSNN